MEISQAIDLTAEVAHASDQLVRPRQLLEVGVTRALVARMKRIHHLRRALHGIYLVGESRLSQRQLHRLALMRAGSAGLLTAYSGLELRTVLWPRCGLATGLTANVHTVGVHLPELPMDDEKHARVVLRRRRRPIESEEVGGLALANVGRSLTDLVEFVGGGLLDIAWSQAEFRSLLVPAALRADLGGGKRPGAPRVAALLDQRDILTTPTTDLRSPPELDWLHLMIDAGLPMPLVNAPVHVGDKRYDADYLWLEYGVALELDSPDHLTPVVAARDRARDDDFDRVGIHTLRLIDTVALADPPPYLERVAGALQRRGWSGS